MFSMNFFNEALDNVFDAFNGKTKERKTMDNTVPVYINGELLKNNILPKNTKNVIETESQNTNVNTNVTNPGDLSKLNADSMVLTKRVATTLNHVPNRVGKENGNVTATKKKEKKPFVSKAILIAPASKEILLPNNELKIGMIVYAKIKGKFIQHKISTIDPKRGIEISKKGHSNGWVKRVYTKVDYTTKI